ncbi:ubiquitin-conjugating enzyme E2 R2 isoform X2 [Myotis myotis]|nr:ubiquitin-conjugating enzyme E2 R2 isoform X2 [Myotis myotis]
MLQVKKSLNEKISNSAENYKDNNRCSLYTVDTNHLLDICIVNMFSHSMACLIPALMMMSFDEPEILIFQEAHIKFPIDYPYSPPTFRFLTKMWHPNIYENGDVCISILHPPVDDPQSGELPSERWNPTQNVRTILLSVISLLNEPNTFSPANVDASVMFRKWRDSKGKDKEYAEIIRKQVSATKAEAEKDGVKVPTTLAEYCIKTKVPSNDNSSDLLYDDLYDDDIDDEDEEEEDADCYDDDDSGNEES